MCWCRRQRVPSDDPTEQTRSNRKMRMSNWKSDGRSESFLGGVSLPARQLSMAPCPPETGRPLGLALQVLDEPRPPPLAIPKVVAASLTLHCCSFCLEWLSLCCPHPPCLPGKLVITPVPLERFTTLHPILLMIPSQADPFFSFKVYLL